MSDNYIQNSDYSRAKVSFVYFVIMLFFCSSLVTAAPVKKEETSASYFTIDEQPIEYGSQYSNNGTGINEENPEWGATNTQMSRQSERYPSNDGNNLTFWDRTDVPNPREISNVICRKSGIGGGSTTL